MKKRLVPLMASILCVLLAGCGKPAEQSGILTDAAQLRAGEIAITVDGQEVEAERYLYWLASACDYLSDAYAAAEEPLDWQQDCGGVTLEEYARQQALETTVLYQVVETWAETYGCALTDEDQTALDQDWTDAAAEYGGEDAYLTALEAVGLNGTSARQLTEDYYLYSHLYDLFCLKNGAQYPGDEKLTAFASEQSCCTVDVFCLPAGEAGAGSKAQEALHALETAADPAECLAALPEKFGGEVRSGVTLFSDREVLSSACEEAARGLEVGAWSGVVETPEGYCILLRQELDLGAVAGAYFDQLLEDASENARITVSKSLKTLDVGAFYDRLTAARETLSAQTQTSSQEG